MAQELNPLLDHKTAWAARMADTMLQSYPRACWKWHYEHALVIKAMTATGAAGGDTNGRFQEVGQAWVDHFVTANGEIQSYHQAEFNLDQVNPGKLLFPVYRRTGEERYAAAIKRLREQLKNQPRNPSGGFWHKKIYPNQMWLDGLFMAGPFYAEYAATFAEPAIFEDIACQFRLIEQHARDPRTGLLYHAWDESKTQKWANPETGCSPHFWGRSIGWYMMAMVDILDFLPEEHAFYPILLGYLNRLAQAMICFQDRETGLWYQVVDLSDRPSNYQETSVSAMLAYGLAKAVRKGWLDPAFLSAARRAFNGLLAHKVRVDPGGAVILEGICSVAGLGGTPYRDGSYSYYVQEPVAANDFKGVGPFILAALEMDRISEKVQRQEPPLP
jgi:unsaturated rhamnogalacturonyl hydrolase